MEKQYTDKKAKSAQLTNPVAETKKAKIDVKAQSSAVDQEKTEANKSLDTKQEAAAGSENKEPAKPTKKEVSKIKKEEATARGLNLHASKKHCMYICNFIKNKSIDEAMVELQKVIKLQRPIPFKGEIPHRSYPGMMSGRYPVKASKEFVYMLKALKGNALVNGLELERTRISFGSANWASRPSKKGGARFKRTHVLLKAKEFSQGEKK